MSSTPLPPVGGVSYRQVHEELEQHGYELRSSRTAGRVRYRVYRHKDSTGPAIHFPVSGKLVSYAVYQKIKKLLEESGQGPQGQRE